MKQFRILLVILAVIVFRTTTIYAQEEKKPTVVFVTGGDEYQSIKRMKPFAKVLEKEYGFKVIYIGDEAPGADTDRDNDPKPTVLPNAEKIKEADLMVVFMRFRNWEPNSLKMFMEHFENGKPAIAIRTTTHAFWKDRTFAPRYFGGHYKTHYTERIVAQVNPEHDNHPIVRGVEKKWGEGEGPYVSIPLTEGVTPLVFSYGHDREQSGVGNDSFDSPNYPVAWAFDDDGARRAMITLGSYRVGDLKADFFQKMFYNSIFWSLGYEVPASGVLADGEDFEMKPEATEYIKKVSEIPSPPAFDMEDWEVLFNGNDLSNFRHYDVTIAPQLLYLDLRANSEGPIDYALSPARWKVENGAMIARPGFGDIISKQHYNNYKLRFDFFVPEYPDWVENEWRGNSGVYLNGSWEISILDTYGLEPSKRSNGAIYRFKSPDKEASKRAGEWQTMEVEFINKEVTIKLNNIVIHDQVKLGKPTFMGFPSAQEWPDESFPEYYGTISEGPIRFQAENSEVRFANVAIQRIWLDDEEDEEDPDDGG